VPGGSTISAQFQSDNGNFHGDLGSPVFNDNPNDGKNANVADGNNASNGDDFGADGDQSPGNVANGNDGDIGQKDTDVGVAHFTVTCL